MPREAADCAPAFDHHPKLPNWTENDCELTLLAGTYRGHRAPVRLYSPLLCLDLYSICLLYTSCGDADLVTGPGELLDEGRAHVAGTDDSNFHADSFLSSGWSEALPLRGCCALGMD